MTSFTISDSQLDELKGQVAVITGASSGIGLATLRRIIKHGGKVFACDVNPLPEPEASSVLFLKADVSSWKEQLDVFKATEKEYGKIDQVFANAGIGKSTTLLDDSVDENGDLLAPRLDTININLIGVIYTVKLAIHYIQKNPNGGSIVITASGSSFQRFPVEDYTSAKHAVLGLVRALQPQLHPKLPIRINAVAPSWTDTAIVPRTIVAALGESIVQSADVVARSVALLMADKRRHGELVYSAAGKFLEMENGTAGFHALTQQMLESKEDEMEKLLAAERRVENVIDNMSEKERQHHTNRAPVTME
ncbi:hypothetical protein AA0113_g3961 [Alternaria arborescens]|uniref:NAD(P)-binding protein n=1 Tax=Alternaria arborescens TaxID=156630 RepID=A0A4Q4SGA5_9PLEO|nr:hypothetical protein AA0111_g8504 [Alternaria arborescens]RYO26053.1 hypothetical protein AA0111_g8504 [Alternaria arborescens]RYO69577.1 hypothetical protein AA0113_g3961 [Alternaria arborescens]